MQCSNWSTWSAVFSHNSPWPSNTAVHYACISWAIDKDVGLFNSYIRLCINIFKNLGHGEVMVHDKQKFVQKNTMSQRWWYWKDPDKFLVLKKIPAHRPYAWVSIHSLNLRKQVGITSVMYITTSCLFSGLCSKPLFRRMPACQHRARACSEPSAYLIRQVAIHVGWEVSIYVYWNLKLQIFRWLFK